MKSTISTKDIIPTATQAVERFTSRKSNDHILPAFGSHYTKEDLVMDAVEKVIRGNPIYLTKSYVYLAAKCACINLINKGKLTHIPEDPSEDNYGSPEDSLIADAYPHLEDLEEGIMQYMSPEETEIYFGLLSRKLYVEIAEDLGISMSSLERRVRDLKYKLQYILTEVEPE